MEEIRSDEVKPQESSYNVEDSLDEHLINGSLNFKDWLLQIDDFSRDEKRDRLTPLGTSLYSHVSSKSSLSLSRLARRMIGRITGKSTLEVANVANFAFEDSSLWGGNLDTLQTGDRFINTCSIPIGGWVAGKSKRVVAARITLNEEFLVDIPLSVSRPDVKTAYLFTNDDCCFGYNSEITLPKRNWRVELKIYAIFEDSSISASINVINVYFS